MASLKKLAGQTAIYGLSSIVGRLLNFLLTPLHTKVLPQEEYGQNTDIYSMVAFLMVVMVFGMETTFFRFFKDNQDNVRKVFSHTMTIVLGISLSILLLSLVFLEPLADLLRYQAHPEYVAWMFLIVSADAVAAVPLAKLRAQNRPVRFVIVRLSTTLTIIAFNLIFYLLFPWLLDQGIAVDFIQTIYDPQLGVAYIFIANLIGNALLLLFFVPDFFKINLRVDLRILKTMAAYSAPLVLAGLAGIINEMANKQFLKYLLPEEIAFKQLGILGANLKIATFMMLFIQAFRYAAEPFFFSGEGDFKDKISRVLRYFVALQTLIYVGIVCFLHWIRYFIDAKYWEGLYIVPILLFANLLLGINFNLNIWYKLKNKTRMGAYITFTGLAFTVVSNLVLVPRLGYEGAAWATLISYASMTVCAFYLNQKHDKTSYPLKIIFMHLGMAVFFAWLSFVVFDSDILYSALLFVVFLIYLTFTEAKPLLKIIRNVRRKDH